MTIIINTASELFDIGIDAEKPLDGDYILGQDIDCSELSPSPIGNADGLPFTGTFDGANFTISNIDMVFADSETNRHVGLFATLGVAAEVKNLLMDACSFVNDKDSGSSTVGSIAGRCQQLNATTEPTQITNCKVTNGTVKSHALVGGLIGLIETSDVTTLKTPLLQMENCSFEGEAILEDYYSVSMGGLVGRTTRTEIEKCYFNGTLSASYNMISGWIGGLIGEAFEMLKMHNCYCQAITTIVTSYNVRIGGLVCRIYSDEDTDIENCYSANDLSETTNSADKMGGLAYSFGDITEPELYVVDCHWDVDIAGTTLDACGVSGEATSVMKTQDTYENWDFLSTWGIIGGSYPNFDLIEAEALEPFLMLEWRNNNKGRWSAPRMIGLGKTGDTKLFKTIRKLGSYKSRQYRLTWSAEVPVIIALFKEVVTLAGEKEDGS